MKTAKDYLKEANEVVKKIDVNEAIEKHKEWLLNGDGQYLLEDLHELKGKVLGCWCNPNQSCQDCHRDDIS